MSKNNGNEAMIECVSRIYRVKMPGGMIADVESTKPISLQMNHELLEEDKEIDSFFANHKILNVRHMVTSQETKVKENEIAERIIFDQGRLTPRQRLNSLLKMKGEFTREDYQKYMFDVYRIKIEKFMAYDDLRGAIDAKRLVKTEEKSGRQQKYKVIDPIEIDEQLYSTMLKEHKAHIEITQ